MEQGVFSDFLRMNGIPIPEFKARSIEHRDFTFEYKLCEIGGFVCLISTTVYSILQGSLLHGKSL